MPFNPAWRARVFAPRSIDSSETTVLTPQATSPSHTDACQIATMTGVSGYQPYLNLPSGRKSTLDMLRRRIKPGGITIEILDVRMTAGGGNASRWFSEYFADAVGETQLMGLRVEVDLAEDRASPSWNRWFTGRIMGATLKETVKWVLAIGDMVEDMDIPVFMGRVHSSIGYVPETQVWPLGITGPYGNAFVTPPHRGTFENATVGGGKAVLLTQTAVDTNYNRIGEALVGSEVRIGDRNISPLDIQYTSRVVARNTINGDEYEVGMLLNQWTSGGMNRANTDIFLNGFRVTEVFIRRLRDVDDVPTGATIPSNGTACDISLRMPNEEPDKDYPLLINDVHCAQFLQDVADGKFSVLDSAGAVIRTFGTSSGFSSFISDGTLPTIRGYITKQTSMKKLFEEVCEQCGLAFRLDRNGDIDLVDMRLPTTLSGIDTLTDLDIIGGGERWSQDRKSAITQFQVKWSVDRYVGPGSARPSDGIVPINNPTLMKPLKRVDLIADFARLDLGDRLHTINGTFIRAGQGEDSTTGINREMVIKGRILDLADEYRHPWGYGPQLVDLLTLRNARTRDLLPGDLLLVDSARLPDPQNNNRGGIRLLRVREVNEVKGGNIQLRLMDSGPNVTLGVPTIGTLAQNGNGIDIPVTVNGAGDHVDVQVAVTPTSVATVGAVADNLWIRRFRIQNTTTITVGSFPSGRRVWVRARSVPSGLSTQLPSGYVHASGPDFIDMPTLSAPTSLATSSVTSLSTKLTWDVGGQQYPVEIHLKSPQGSSIDAGGADLLTTLGALSNEYWVQGTVDSDTYRAAVRLYDGAGGYSPFSGEVTWTASGTPPVAAAPTGLAALSDPGLP